MRYVPEGEEEPPQVRRLRLMAMALMGILIVGFVAMVGTIVIRLGLMGDGLVEAEAFQLPEGRIVATGRGDGTVLFVLEREGAETLLVYDAGSGALESQTPILRD